MLRRRSENRNIQTTVPPGAIDNRQRGCGQQLCPRPLHHRQGDRGTGARSDPKSCRPVHRATRIPDIPFVRRRYRFRFYVVAHGTLEFRLREKEQTGIRHLPGPSSKSEKFKIT